MSWFRFAALALLALIAVNTGPAVADRAVLPWCTADMGYDGTVECSYYTKKQCMEAAWGNGMSCQQNPWYYWSQWYPNKPYPPQRTFRSLLR
jgi:hypothetical protein